MSLYSIIQRCYSVYCTSLIYKNKFLHNLQVYEPLHDLWCIWILEPGDTCKIHIHHPKSIYTNALNNQYISIVVYNDAKLLTYAFDHELTE